MHNGSSGGSQKPYFQNTLYCRFSKHFFLLSLKYSSFYSAALKQILNCSVFCPNAYPSTVICKIIQGEAG